MTFSSLAEWQLEAIRLVFLSNTPIGAAQKNWWQMAIGSPPSAISTRPAQMEHQEVGNFEDAELAMANRFNHVEWMLRSQPSPPVSGKLPSLGSGDGALHRIDEPMLRWVQESGLTFQRLAFCPIFFRPADNLVEATQVAARYFPGFNGAEVEDLGGQFNIPKQSEALPDVRINRILKIATGQVQTFTIGPSPIPVVESKFVTRVELDFNTAFQRSEPIPIDVFPALLAELQREAVKAVSEGLL